MIETCHDLFQINKNPSDTEIEKEFKAKIKNNYPQKMQELSDSMDGMNYGKQYILLYILFLFSLLFNQNAICINN